MGEYLQEAVLPVQYDNYVFDLYGTLVDIHTEEDFPKLWEKLALFFGYYGAIYEPKELQKRYAALVSDCERALKRRWKRTGIIRMRHLRRLRSGKCLKNCIRKKGSWPIRPLPYILDSFSVRCLPIMSVCIRGHSRCLPV